MVPEEGVEPSLPEGNGILSPARLPVSPLRLEEELPLYVERRGARHRARPNQLATTERTICAVRPQRAASVSNIRSVER